MRPFRVRGDELTGAADNSGSGFTMADARAFETVERQRTDLLGHPKSRNRRRSVSAAKRLQIYIATGIYNLLNFAGLCVALCGGIVVAFQGFLWLHDGVWTKLELRAGLRALAISEPVLDWVGAQRAFSWALDLPISAALVGLGLLLVAAAVAYLEPLTSHSA